MNVSYYRGHGRYRGTVNAKSSSLTLISYFIVVLLEQRHFIVTLALFFMCSLEHITNNTRALIAYLRYKAEFVSRRLIILFHLGLSQTCPGPTQGNVVKSRGGNLTLDTHSVTDNKISLPTYRYRNIVLQNITQPMLCRAPQLNECDWY